MITAIYGNKNGTQDSIAWWLCEEPQLGPQIYVAPWKSPTERHRKKFDNPMLGTLAEDQREVEYSDLHIETLRIMENEPLVDFLAPLRTVESEFQQLIWSNYFGAMVDPAYKIPADRVIICQQSYLEDCFHYVISHAFKLLTEERIADDSEVWWMDHVYVNGTDVGDWKKIWYQHYHQRCLSDYQAGKLKYMWQLNYLHWDLMQAILKNKGRELHCQLTPADDLDRLFRDKLRPEFQTTGVSEEQDLILETIKHNPGALIVQDPIWFEQADAILDYLGIAWTSGLQENLSSYQDAYRSKREWFDTTFAELIKKYRK